MLSIKNKKHYDLIAAFEKIYPTVRPDKEPKELWDKGYIYQNGEANNLFIAYRLGYAFGKYVGAHEE